MDGRSLYLDSLTNIWSGKSELILSMMSVLSRLVISAGVIMAHHYFISSVRFEYIHKLSSDIFTM